MEELDAQLDLSSIPHGLAFQVKVVQQFYKNYQPDTLTYQIVQTKANYGKDASFHVEVPYVHLTNVYLCIAFVYLLTDENIVVLFGAAYFYFGRMSYLQLTPELQVGFIVSRRPKKLQNEVFNAIRCKLAETQLFQLQGALQQVVFYYPRVLIGQNGYYASGAIYDGTVYFVVDRRFPIEIRVQATLNGFCVVLCSKYIDYAELLKCEGLIQLPLSDYASNHFYKEAYELADAFNNQNTEALISTLIYRHVFDVVFVFEKKYLKKMYNEVFKSYPKELQKLIKKHNYNTMSKNIERQISAFQVLIYVSIPFGGRALSNFQPSSRVAFFENCQQHSLDKAVLSGLIRYILPEQLEKGEAMVLIRSSGIFQFGPGAFSFGSATPIVDFATPFDVLERATPILIRSLSSELYIADASSKEVYSIDGSAVRSFLALHSREDCAFCLRSSGGTMLPVLAVATKPLGKPAYYPPYQASETAAFRENNTVQRMPITDETIVISGDRMHAQYSVLERLQQENAELQAELLRAQCFETNLIANAQVQNEAERRALPGMDSFPNLACINIIKYYCGIDQIPPNTTTRLDLMQFLANFCSFKRLTYAVVNMISEVTGICQEASRVYVICGQVQSDLCLEQECIIGQMENKLLYLEKLEARNKLLIERQKRVLMGPQENSLAYALTDASSAKKSAKSKPPSVLAPLRGERESSGVAEVLDEINQMLK